MERNGALVQSAWVVLHAVRSIRMVSISGSGCDDDGCRCHGVGAHPLGSAVRSHRSGRYLVL